MSEISRLRWLCRRGMKELDLVLTGYLDHHYPNVSEGEQAQFRQLLEMQDPELYRLILGKEPEGNEELVKVLQLVRTLAQASG
ncbi:MAG: succinate dehydrogenase assembly factor 2 [Gammaproteobacteria bacterium]|nr:succinate dehydrogenase assembly factor 2 [Gammaproteobacteria bacterium]MCP5418142.1 succinate dehydrogenase assembly factor 2 [Chromatiaceae bacterium]